MTMKNEEIVERCRWCKHLSRQGEKFYCDVLGRSYCYKSVLNGVSKKCENRFEESALDAISGRPLSEKVKNEARCFRCGAYLGTSLYDGECYCEKCRTIARKEDNEKIRENMSAESCVNIINAIVENLFREYAGVLYDIMEYKINGRENEEMKWGLLYQKRKLENYMFSRDFQMWNIEGIDINRMIDSIQKSIGYSEEEHGA